MNTIRPHDIFRTLRSFSSTAHGQIGQLHSLRALAESGFPRVDRLPVSLRVLLESMLRNCDGIRVRKEHVEALCCWEPQGRRHQELPFLPARILLQDLNGVPLLADLAAMREVAAEFGRPASQIQPEVPVEMVIDHSVQVDHFGTTDALLKNQRIEFERNEERYSFMKWGAQAFDNLKVIEPGVGICHQVNLEHLASCVGNHDGMYFPDTVVCPDSHTTMINGIGTLGWGVGGIEAEAGMLGQPVFLLMPNVVGVELVGKLAPGVTATDAVLAITERLRQERVVGDFVEFIGDGARNLAVLTRATIANMAPEYGAFIGFFPVDDHTLAYFESTGRPTDVAREYLQQQGLLGIPDANSVDYSRLIRVDLSAIEPCVAGPKRPQDRIALTELKDRFEQLLQAPAPLGLQARSERHRTSGGDGLQHGDILLAAITSCTNTSNPAVMVAAGLLARQAVRRGLRVPDRIKTSMAPGSRAVTALLVAAGLLADLEQLGFAVVAYGCTTCIGNSGPLDAAIEEEVTANNVVGCAVLSGNRNFEGRIHPAIKANFLASPPLVVAFALAGRMDIDLNHEPVGHGTDGAPVFLRDIWPSDSEIARVVEQATNPRLFIDAYAPPEKSFWSQAKAPTGAHYVWEDSDYIVRPPFFDGFSLQRPPRPKLNGGRALAVFGDSLTTDHISPAGSIPPMSAAGQYLQQAGVRVADFNSYGARRGNHEVMVRGTFAHARIANLLLPVTGDDVRREGGYTLAQPSQDLATIYDAAMTYQAQGVPSFVFGGQEYGTGSARDWAAKGTRLLGVATVIVESFERIHRSNLVLMGVLPCELADGTTLASLELTGREVFDVLGLESDAITPRQPARLQVSYPDGSVHTVPLRVRLDTPIEVQYYLHGGITQYVLRRMLNEPRSST